MWYYITDNVIINIKAYNYYTGTLIDDLLSTSKINSKFSL